METDKPKCSRGGKRANSGRNGGKGISTTAMSLKLDNDLFMVLKTQGQNKNRYINDAVRAKMKNDGYIK